MVTDAELCKDWERICLDEISYHQKSIGEMNQIREQNPEDWKIQELCRAIIFDETQIIQGLMEEIRDGREGLEGL